MSKPHAVRALEKKRADLKADLAHLTTCQRQTLAAIAHINATLALLKEAKARGAPNGLQRRWLFKRGELRRLISTVERETARPLTHREVARAIMARMGWDDNDLHLVIALAEKVKASRRNIRRAKQRTAPYDIQT